jgi:hypothetical protein
MTSSSGDKNLILEIFFFLAPQVSRATADVSDTPIFVPDYEITLRR